MKKQLNHLTALWIVTSSDGDVVAIGDSETCCAFLECSTQAIKNCWYGKDGKLKKEGYSVERYKVNSYRATHVSGRIEYGSAGSLMDKTGLSGRQIYNSVKKGTETINGWKVELLEAGTKEFAEHLERMEPGENLFDYDRSPSRKAKEITVKDINTILRVLYDAEKRVQKKMLMSHDQMLMAQYKELLKDVYMSLTEMENEYHKRKANENG